MELSRLTRDGTAESVSREQILRRECGQGNIHFPCSADHEQDWQSYPVDPNSCYMYDDTYYIKIKFCVLRQSVSCLMGYNIQYAPAIKKGEIALRLHFLFSWKHEHDFLKGVFLILPAVFVFSSIS